MANEELKLLTEGKINTRIGEGYIPIENYSRHVNQRVGSFGMEEKNKTKVVKVPGNLDEAVSGWSNLCPKAYESCQGAKYQEIFYNGTLILGPCINGRNFYCAGSQIEFYEGDY